MRDLSRGWAWTRALLGISADEIHLCGEAAAIDLVSVLYPYVIHGIPFNLYPIHAIIFETIGNIEKYIKQRLSGFEENLI